jgi:DNA topoisomerase VI subunit B
METLQREVFETNRILEYFTEKELRAQIGYGVEFWPVAILRELIDNSLDACEAASVQPVIEVEVRDDLIIVSDNGTGIPAETVRKSLNYMSRVSDKAYYVSPTRGQMGNALKVIYAAPYVSAGKGYVEIASRGIKHLIQVCHDRISGQTNIKHETTEFVKNGTSVKILWEDSTRLLLNPETNFFTSPQPTPGELISGYSAFNPHATFILNGESFQCTTPVWEKWRPNMPTSAHWYTTETLRDLIAGYLTQERSNGNHIKTVREFVSEFRGLAGTAKQKAVTGDFQRAYLNNFEKDGDIDKEKLNVLLSAMKAESAAPRPKALGIIGKNHFQKWMVAQDASADSIQYCKKEGIDGGLPYVLEVGFAVSNNDNATRQLIIGLNWSPTIGCSPDDALSNAIQQARIDRNDPAIFLIHISRPRFEFMDRGKTKIELGFKDVLISAIKSVTKQWKAAKRKADKEDKVASRHLNELRRKVTKISLRDAAFDVMENAYNKVSSNGKYYANARQIMYAARPDILRYTNKSELDDVYFTQTLLKDYIEQEGKDNWKVVWDARGHMIEPFTNHKIGLGGIDVEKYGKEWHSGIDIDSPEIPVLISTSGPANRFKNVLFVEKEGFTEVLTHAKIPERYDMAIMSTKGIPVKAACDLINEFEKQDVRVFVLHDFDVDGFKIMRTLREGTRMASGSDAIELGLRFEDIEGLPSEPVSYKSDPELYLKYDCGASSEEIKFLLGTHGYRYGGRRVEINAMTSEQLITWLECKFEQYEVEKVIPDDTTLRTGFKRANHMKQLIRKIQEQEYAEDIEIPDDLSQQVVKLLQENPEISWDQALWDIV